MDIITTLSVVSIIGALGLIYLIIIKYKPSSIGDFVVALSIKEITLIMIVAIIVVSISEATTAASLIHRGSEHELSDFARYIAHGVLGALGSLLLMVAVYQLVPIINNLTNGFKKDSRWAKSTKTKTAYYFISFAAVLLLLFMGSSFVYQNGYLIAALVGELELYTSYWGNFGNTKNTTIIYNNFSMPMKITMSMIIAHLTIPIVEGIFVLIKILLWEDNTINNILNSTPPKKEVRDPNKAIEENLFKKADFESTLKYILKFYSNDAENQYYSKLLEALKKTQAEEEIKISVNVIEIKRKIENYLKKDWTGKEDHKRSEALTIKKDIHSKFSNSPSNGGFGITLKNPK